jgi:hypothetical protein
MEKGLAYIIITCIIIMLVTAGSFKRGFHPARFTLSTIALFFAPGLAAALWKGIHLMASDPVISLPLAAGILAGLIFYQFVLIKWRRFSTFEHELTHALVALLFFRKIKKFVVTRNEGGYIVNTSGFGGETGNHFIALAPYFLPTFTLLSVMIRPLLPATWFPWYDAWIGITFSYQTMSNYWELKQNWTAKSFRQAKTGLQTRTDIGQEGFIFSFIMILTLKLFIISMMIFIITGNYAALTEWLSIILKHSTGFYVPVFEEIYRYFVKIITL